MRGDGGKREIENDDGEKREKSLMYRLPLVNQPINQEQNKRNVLCVRYPVDHRPL